MLPPHHSDPFDRLLIAQAITESIPILTHDEISPITPSR
jgi:PIN domain nuclease of toxin-antitoxin system